MPPLVEREGAERLVYRRRIRLLAVGPQRVVGALEDNPHHFRVAVRHDGRRVTDVAMEAVRFPWSTCPGAAAPLRALVGTPLSPRSTAVGAVADARSNCTHAFDLAGLCIAHAHAARAQGRVERDYACAVWNDPAAGAGRTRAVLDRDGERLLDWVIEGDAIVRPAPFAGAVLHARFMRWVEANLDAEQGEAALVLRRACFVAPSRLFDFDHVACADELEHMQGRCHTFSEAHVHEALRMHRSFRDFTADAAAMCAGLPGPAPRGGAAEDEARRRGAADGGGPQSRG